MFETIDREKAAAIAGGVLLAIYLVQYAITLLRARGVIPDGDAGKWNEGLSGLVGLVVLIVGMIGGKLNITEIEAVGKQAGEAVALVLILVGGANLLHKYFKWTRGGDAVPNITRYPKPQG